MDLGKILYVDDDKLLTSTFSTLMKVEGFKNVVTYNNPVEAIEYLKLEAPDLIISDFIMPEMNGLEFLREAKKLYPETSMILLTAYADKENAIKTINEIGVYKYIEKPWDNDDLIMNIRNGIERSHLLANLRDKIAQLEEAKAQQQEVPAEPQEPEEVPEPQKPGIDFGEIIGTVINSQTQTKGRRSKKTTSQKALERAATQAAGTAAREVTKGIMRGLFGQMK